MKRFTVCLTRDVTESLVVEVEASDAEEAERKARDYYEQHAGEQTEQHPNGVEFETDDCISEAELSWVEED
jgi:hypothetical protein